MGLTFRGLTGPLARVSVGSPGPWPPELSGHDLRLEHLRAEAMQTRAAWVAWTVQDPQKGSLVWARVSPTLMDTALLSVPLADVGLSAFGSEDCKRESGLPRARVKSQTLPLCALGAIQGPLVRPSQRTRGAKTINDKRRLARD